MPLRAPPRGIPWTPNAERGRRLQEWFNATDAPSLLIENGTPPERRVKEWVSRSGSGRIVGNAGSLRAILLGAAASGLPMVRYGTVDQLHLGSYVPTITNPFNVGAKGFFVASAFRVTDAQAYSPLDGGGDTYIWERGPGPGALDNPLWSCKIWAISGGMASLGIQMRDNEGFYLTLSFGVGDVKVGAVNTLVAGHIPWVGQWAFLNGVQTANTGYTAVGNIHPQPLALVRAGYGFGNTFDMGDWLFFNDGTDTALRERVEGYLAHKWGIRLPTSHPYATRPPTRVAR